MKELYIIEARYETIQLNGKSFVNWFIFENNPLPEKEAKEKIKVIKKDFGYIDTKTKLKHEYRLKLYSEYENELKELNKNVQILTEKQKAYYKSNEYKELQKKKRIANKELKERQKKYLEEHKKEADT